MKNKKNILITGGLGFIGSHVVEHFSKKYPEYKIYLLDSVTYAANKDFLNKIMSGGFENVEFLREDIRNNTAIKYLFQQYDITDVIHLAAESHVDNSIENPNVFVETNVMGTVNLLNAAINNWSFGGSHVFYHISTDEVYGSLDYHDSAFTEKTSYDPKSPYSASKAASDHFVRAYGNTYKLPYIISNCSNNYGERQHEEKLLPKTILNILQGKKVPVYGDGMNIRDWLYVGDHVNAIDRIFHLGSTRQTYNIGGDQEISNIGMVRMVIEAMNSMFATPKYKEMQIIEFVEDRKGHDFRYAINHDKLTKELGWKPEYDLTMGLRKTISYYMEYYANEIEQENKYIDDYIEHLKSYGNNRR